MTTFLQLFLVGARNPPFSAFHSSAISRLGVAPGKATSEAVKANFDGWLHVSPLKFPAVWKEGAAAKGKSVGSIVFFFFATPSQRAFSPAAHGANRSHVEKPERRRSPVVGPDPAQE